MKKQSPPSAQRLKLKKMAQIILDQQRQCKETTKYSKERQRTAKNCKEVKEIENKSTVNYYFFGNGQIGILLDTF